MPNDEYNADLTEELNQSELEAALDDLDDEEPVVSENDPVTEVDDGHTGDPEPKPPDDTTGEKFKGTEGSEENTTPEENPDTGEPDEGGTETNPDDSSSGEETLPTGDGDESIDNPPENTEQPDDGEQDPPKDDNTDPEQPDTPEEPPKEDDPIVVLPPVDVSKLAGELRDLPVSQVIDPEDYIIVNKDKDILQVRFGDMLLATMKSLEYEHTDYPDANKLTELINSMIQRQNNIKAADIIWDGDNHKNYGTVRAAIMYIMDTIDKLGGNISGTNITINPDGDTPQNVIEDLNGRNKLNDVLNYIYANYRREDTMVPGSMVRIDTSNWRNSDLKVSYKSLNADEALLKLYTYMTTGIDKTAKAYYQNPLLLDIPMKDDEFEIGHYFINVPEATRLDLTASLEIFCRVPGTIIIDVYYDSTKVFSLKDAFTTGYHTTNYVKTMIVDTIDPDNIGHKITFNGRYYTDTMVSGVLVPASIEEGGFLSIISGQRISVREGEE